MKWTIVNGEIIIHQIRLFVCVCLFIRCVVCYGIFHIYKELYYIALYFVLHCFTLLQKKFVFLTFLVISLSFFIIIKNSTRKSKYGYKISIVGCFRRYLSLNIEKKSLIISSGISNLVRGQLNWILKQTTEYFKFVITVNNFENKGIRFMPQLNKEVESSCFDSMFKVIFLFLRFEIKIML